MDIENPHHLWLLCFLFFDMINAECDQFCSDWNAHPISGDVINCSPSVGSAFQFHLRNKNTQLS